MSRQIKKQRPSQRQRKRRNNGNSSRSLNLIISLLIFTLLVIMTYFISSKILVHSCVDSLSLVSKFSLDGDVIILNEDSINLNSPLLFIKKVDGLDGKVSKSSITELVNSLSSSKVEFSKKLNILVYRVVDGNYNTFSSSKVKIRFSKLNDGYLLEVNNKTKKDYTIYYNKNGESSLVNSSSDSNLANSSESNLASPIILKSGLNQLFIDGDVDVNSLCKSILTNLK